MRKFLLLGSLCLGGLLLASVGCGSDSNSSKPKENTGTPTPPGGGSGPPGDGAGLNYVEVCKAAARAMSREEYCKQDVDIEHDKDRIDEKILADEIEDTKAKCAENKPPADCPNPNPKAIQACYDAIAKAADCKAVKELGNSADCQALCSGSDKNPQDDIDACKATAEQAVRADMCDPEPPTPAVDVAETPEAQARYQEEVQKHMAACEKLPPGGLAEEFRKEGIKCDTLNLKAFEACFKAIDEVKGCDNVNAALKNSNCQSMCS